MKITRVETELLCVPLPRPVALPASQDPRAAKHAELLLARVHTDGGQSGLGLTYALGGSGAALRAVVDELIAPMLVGEDPARTEWLFVRAAAELEGVGFPGLAARAYAAIDTALWDWKGRAAGLPVHQLLGGYRTKLKALAADTATPALGAKQAAKETRELLERGAAGVVVEVGTRDPDVDADRIRQLRESVPDGAWFEVSGAGRYDFSSGLWVGRFCEDEIAADGFSEPLRADDLCGLARLTDRLELSLSAGGLLDTPHDFVRLLDEVKGLTAVRVDPIRLGGITPARKVLAAAELRHVAVCPVRCPEVGVHLACSVVWGRVAEYVDWFADLFAGGPRFHDGQLVAPAGPGLGLELREPVAERFRP